MSVEIWHPSFRTVIGDDPKLERIATGFDFTEGPAWHPLERHLVFSDIPGNQLWLRAADGAIRSYRTPSGKANGNTYDRLGRLLSCEHATSRVSRQEPDGSITALASHYQGRELNSPNDIVVRSDAGIYFTDPAYGRLPHFGLERPRQLPFCGVYRVEDDGSNLTLLVDDFDTPNGLCFSHDEKRLFVNDTKRGHIRVFDVDPGGLLSGGEVWADVTGRGDGAPDGMKLDRDGNLYCCGPGGLHIFSPEGTCLGFIEVPEVLANFTWGDHDLMSLYLTASTSLYHLRTATPGRPLF